MKTRQEIKMEAKSILKRNLSNILIMFLPLTLLSLIVSGGQFGISFQTNSHAYQGTTFDPNIRLTFSIAVFVIAIIQEILLLGITEGILKKEYTIDNTLSYFKNGKLTIALKVILLELLFTILWALIPIAGIFIAIVKGYSYSMATYFLVRDVKFESARDYLSESVRLMNGYKMDLFILYLSFLGWYLLVPFTFGLGYLLLIPYTTISTIFFMNNIFEKEYNKN